MAFGTPFAPKPRAAEPVRPVTGVLVRIVLLALLATATAAYGVYLYYTHAFRPARTPSPAASSSIEELSAPELVPVAPSSSARTH
jgi:hypothetical protein